MQKSGHPEPGVLFYTENGPYILQPDKYDRLNYVEKSTRFFHNDSCRFMVKNNMLSGDKKFTIWLIGK